MTEKQIHWLGELAIEIVSLGFLWVLVRMVDGPTMHHTIEMPSALRWMLLAVVVIAATTFRTNRFYRKQARRAR